MEFFGYVRCFNDFVSASMGAFVFFVVDLQKSRVCRSTPKVAAFPGLRFADSRGSFNHIEHGVERFVAQAWGQSSRYGSWAWSLAGPRAVFGLVFRCRYSP
jgi:hypothetical protein